MKPTDEKQPGLKGRVWLHMNSLMNKTSLHGACCTKWNWNNKNKIKQSLCWSRGGGEGKRECECACVSAWNDKKKNMESFSTIRKSEWRLVLLYVCGICVISTANNKKKKKKTYEEVQEMHVDKDRCEDPWKQNGSELLLDAFSLAYL